MGKNSSKGSRARGGVVRRKPSLKKAVVKQDRPIRKLGLELGNFAFREQDRIGYNDADNDRQFLSECFVDTGDFDALGDLGDPRCLVLGRTGAGKTALLMQVEDKEERVIKIDPDSLALTYISNSQIIKYLINLGVDLDVFFKFLWRHVFCLELIKKHYQITDEEKSIWIIEQLKSVFIPQHRKAVEYLEQYSGKFWEETETKIEERTKTLEANVTAELKSTFGNHGFTLADGEKLSETHKEEIIRRVQPIVNEGHLSELSKVIEMLEFVLNKEDQKVYYIVLDKLDEQWVEDSIRYKLLRSLIDTISHLNRKIPKVKIMASFRLDLLTRVYELSKGGGFQREKYNDLELNLDWDQARLTEVMDKRVNMLIRSRYSVSESVSASSILPRTIDNVPAISYILERTLFRPRDVIDFFNKCISLAKDSPMISEETVRKAEGQYSKDRLSSLADEWRVDYPHLDIVMIDLLKGKRRHFHLNEITDTEIQEFALKYATREDSLKSDPVYNFSKDVVEGKLATDEFRSRIASVLYRVTAIGLKTESYEAMIWSHKNQTSIHHSQIPADISVSIHPCFWRALQTQK